MKLYHTVAKCKDRYYLRGRRSTHHSAASRSSPPAGDIIGSSANCLRGGRGGAACHIQIPAPP
eukprot:521218-Prorocentrum_minimum.AAC.2